jgi:hypothetical protein
MIEGRAEVVDDLADLNTPHWIRDLLDPYAEGKDARPNIEMDARSVRTCFEIGDKLGFKSVDLVACSRELQSDP